MASEQQRRPKMDARAKEGEIVTIPGGTGTKILQAQEEITQETEQLGSKDKLEMAEKDRLNKKSGSERTAQEGNNVGVSTSVPVEASVPVWW